MHRGAGDRLAGVRRWPLWALPRTLRAYVIVVNGGWVAAAVFAAYQLATGSVVDPLMLLTAVLLLGCGVATIEATRPTGQAANRPWRTMIGAWTLPLILLLPPWWALVLPPALALLVQLRVTRSVAYRAVFTAAAVGWASAAAAFVFHTITGSPLASDSPNLEVWVTAGAAAGGIRVLVNLLLVATAVRATDPEATWQSLLLSRDGSTVDVVEISSGLVVAVLAVMSPWLILLTVPGLVYLVARNAAAHQLETLATVDHKTGVLTAGAWEREATLVIARAHRSRTPAAVLMLDCDDFKAVNDTVGHLGGDLVLKVIAGEIRSQVRPIDLVGRFGGDEFAVLLVDTDADAAYDVAERLRAHVAQLAVPAGATAIRITISVGMVTMPSSRVDVADLLAAADHALYDSKRSGRNRTSRLSIDHH